MNPIDDGPPGSLEQKPAGAVSKATQKRKLLDELRELGSIIGIDESELGNAAGGLQTSDFWDDVPVLEDMVQASPEPSINPTKDMFDLAPLVKTVEQEVESEIVKPLTDSVEQFREVSRESAAETSANSEAETTASAAERAVDKVDARLREKFGRGLPSDLADEVWQILYDFLENRKS